MKIIFDTTGYMFRKNFKPETSARLFKKLWDWAENFDRMIANDCYIKINTLSIKKEDGNPLNESLIITVEGTAYGLGLEEQMHFSINDILYPKRTKESFDERLTQCLVESFERIEVMLTKKSASINKTLAGLGAK